MPEMRNPGARQELLNYMPQLDGLRALAVAAVLVHHLLDPELVARFLAWVPLGFVGVRLFFVLSGFLITGILIRERDRNDGVGAGRARSLRNFYMRRTLRIFPLYYFVLLLTLVFGAQSEREQLPWLATYTYNLYLSNLGWWPAYFSHFWSLSVEEQFYLFWPWVLLFAPRRWLPTVCVAMIAIALAYRWFAIYAQLNPVAIYGFTLSSLDALGIGSLLALACRGGAVSQGTVRALRNSALPIGLLGALLLTATNADVLHTVFFETLVALVFVWLVAAASRGFSGIPGRWLQLPVLVYLGKISYGIYVYHLFMPHLLRPLLDYAGIQLLPRGAAEFTLSCVATVATAALSWTLLERPMVSMKTRLVASGPATEL